MAVITNPGEHLFKHKASKITFNNSTSGLSVDNLQEAADSMVPYSGANKNVNIGTYSLTTTGDINIGMGYYSETRVIDTPHKLADKFYVDMAVADLGARYYALDTDSTISDGAGGTYRLTSIDPSPDSETSVEVASLADGNTFIRGWISPVGAMPTKLLKGTYDFYLQVEKISGTKTLQIYWELVEYTALGAETVIATSAYSDTITSKADQDPFLVLASDHTPAVGSRIIGKVYAYVSGGGNPPTIKIYYRGDAQAHWLIPTNLEILTEMFVSYTDANQNIIPDASGTIEFGESDTPFASGYFDTTYTKSIITTGFKVGADQGAAGAAAGELWADSANSYVIKMGI